MTNAMQNITGICETQAGLYTTQGNVTEWQFYDMYEAAAHVARSFLDVNRDITELAFWSNHTGEDCTGPVLTVAKAMRQAALGKRPSRSIA